MEIHHFMFAVLCVSSVHAQGTNVNVNIGGERKHVYNVRLRHDENVSKCNNQCTYLHV